MSYEDFAGRSRLSLGSFVLGPLAVLPRSFFGGLALLVLAAALAGLTQVGGLLFWLAFPLLDRLYLRLARHRAATAGLLFATTAFFGMYLMVTFLVVPSLAALAGRVALPCAGDPLLKPVTKWTCLASRHYVTSDLLAKLEALARAMDQSHPGHVVYYLDAGFPFGFDLPMPPHLSHQDGRQVDLAFAYMRESGGSRMPAPPPSPIGYWNYEQPGLEEAQPCSSTASLLRWDLPWLQGWFPEAFMDDERTRAMITWLLAGESRSPVRRILIEPHLADRLVLTDPRVRFQGCDAARHDDHFHLEL